jgi:hypothetical protein
MKPRFAEAHFQFGNGPFCLGKKDEPTREYETLQNLDKDLAKKFKVAIDK